MTAWQRLTLGVLALTFAAALPALAQPPVAVTAADPASGEQDTAGLIIKVTGKNFGANARTDFFKSGTSDPAGIVVRSSRVVSNTQIEATIDISSGAALSLFDIRVTNTNGRTGKGTDLFRVVEKGARVACTVEPLDTTRFQLAGTLNSLVGGAPLFQGVFGADVKARRATLSYSAGSRDVLLVAVSTGEGTGRVEIFFLDPLTGALLDGTMVVPGGPVQPHVTIVPQALTAAGGQLAIGDVNGDGLPDLVSQRSSGDQVTLMVATRAADGVIGYTATLVPPPAQSLKFGFAAAMGDVTGDGRDEIVLAKILFGVGKKVEYPAVHVYTAPTGTPVLIARVAAPETQVKTDSGYGGDVAVGDVTGDGLADVMVAAPHWKVGDAAEAGAVFLHVATGGPGVLASTPVILSGPSPATFDHFASRVAVANLDGDPSGQVDALALDHWDSSEITGDVFVGPLLASGQTTSPSLRIAPRPGLTTGWGTRGAALADFDANSLTDIVVGAPNAPDAGCNSIGIAYVFLAQGTPATGTTGWVRLSIQPPTTDGDYSAFGWSAATAAGSPLIVIGERDRDLGGGVHAGQVYIYRVIQ